MINSVQSAPGNVLPMKMLPAKVLAKDAGPVSSEGSPAKPTAFHSELESLRSDEETQSGTSPRPPQRKRTPKKDETNPSVPLAAVSDLKKQALPPLALAMPTLQASPASAEDATATQPAQPANSQPREATPEFVDVKKAKALDTKAPKISPTPILSSAAASQVRQGSSAPGEDGTAIRPAEPAKSQPGEAPAEPVDLKPNTPDTNIPDTKTPEIGPTALAFAARLSAPIFSAASVSQIRLQPLPSRQDASSQNPTRPQAATKAPDSRVPDRPPTAVSAVASTGQTEMRRDKQQELPSAVRAASADFVAPPSEPQSSPLPVAPNAQVQSPVPSLAAQLDRVIEPASAPQASSNDIRVSVPDNSGGSTEVRFVEAAGEVRVSVRTANPDIAQTLRGGLDELTHKLSNEGVRTEMWHPGVAAAASQGDFSQRSSQSLSQQSSQQPPQQDQPGSGGQDRGRDGSGNQDSEGRGQRGSQQPKPQWLEELEASTTDRNN